MSSIISDIFYGSKQNILDQYLIDRNEAQQFNQSSIVQPEHDHVYQDKTSYVSISGINNNVFTLQFLFKEFEKNDQQVYEFSLQLGKKQTKDYVQIDQKGIAKQNVSLQGCSYEFIKQHKSIKVQIRDGKLMRSKKSFGHIPIESIIQAILLNDKKNSRNLDIILKGTLQTKKIKAQLKVFSDLPQSQHYRGSGSKFLDNKILEDGVNNESWNQQRGGIIHNIVDRGSFQLSQFGRKPNSTAKQEISNSNVHRMLDGSSSSQMQWHNQQNRNHYREKVKLPQEVQYYQNYIIKNQNRNKNYHRNTDKVIFDKVVFYAINVIKDWFNQDGQQKIRKTMNYQIRVNTMKYNLNQRIQIKDISNQGVYIQVNQYEDQIERYAGACHLNPLILLSNEINGQFPILNRQGKHFGRLQLQSQSKFQLHQFKNRQQNLNIVNYQPEDIYNFESKESQLKYNSKFQRKYNKNQTSNLKSTHKNCLNTDQLKENDKQIQSLVIINLQKILILFVGQEIPVSRHQKNSIVIRSQENIKSHGIRVKKIQQNLFQIKLLAKESIVLKYEKPMIQTKKGKDKAFYGQHVFPVEFEVYIDSCLVSYSKINFICSQKHTNYLQFFQGYVDGGSQGFICQLYHESYLLSYQKQYFITEKIGNIVQVLNQRQMLKKIRKSSLQQNMNLIPLLINIVKQRAKKQQSQRDLALRGITFTQCERVIHLLIKNYEQTIDKLFTKLKHMPDKHNNTVQTGLEGNNSIFEIRQELFYLDPQRLGLVSFQAWKKVCEYYDIDSGLSWVISPADFMDQESVANRCQDTILKQKIELQSNCQGEQVLPYLFVLAGYMIQKQQIAINNQAIECNKEVQADHLIKTSNQPQIINKQALQKYANTKRTFHVIQICAKNLHLITGKVPTTFISLNPNKFCYSNANPIFKITKEIQFGTTIHIYNRTINKINDDNKIICSFVIDGKRQKYIISDKVWVQVKYWQQYKNNQTIAEN